MLEFLTTLGGFLYLISFVSGLYCGWSALFSTNPFNGEPLSKSFSNEQFIRHLQSNNTAEEYLAINLLIKMGILVYLGINFVYKLELSTDFLKRTIFLTRLGMGTVFLMAFVPPVAITYCFLFFFYKAWLERIKR